MIKLNLKIKNKEDNSVTTEQHEIEEMDLFQIEDTLNVVGSVLLMAQENPSLQALLDDTLDKVDADSDVAVEGEKFVANLVGSLDLLLMTIPGKIFELLSAMSGVELNKLKQQKLDIAFDIFDAVIKENDVRKLIQRGKQSFSTTRSQLTVTNPTKPKAVVTPKKTKQA